MCEDHIYLHCRLVCLGVLFFVVYSVVRLPVARPLLLQYKNPLHENDLLIIHSHRLENDERPSSPEIKFSHQIDNYTKWRKLTDKMDNLRNVLLQNSLRVKNKNHGRSPLSSSEHYDTRTAEKKAEDRFKIACQRSSTKDLSPLIQMNLLSPVVKLQLQAKT